MNSCAPTPRIPILIAVLATGAGCATAPPKVPDTAALRIEVAGVETAFAKSMADRDFKAFAGFVAGDAVFLDGGKPLRGREAVLASWKPLFEGANAPFSWHPELVEVLANGTLAESTGPVYDAHGTVIAHYYSTWRRDAPGVWHIVFDNGYDECTCRAAAGKSQ